MAKAVATAQRNYREALARFEQADAALKALWAERHPGEDDDSVSDDELEAWCAERAKTEREIGWTAAYDAIRAAEIALIDAALTETRRRFPKHPVWSNVAAIRSTVSGHNQLIALSLRLAA